MSPAPSVSLARDMEQWRITTTTDNKAEKDFADALETYSLLPESKIGAGFKWRSTSFDVPQVRVLGAMPHGH
jgi:hypothetical protein